MTFKNFVKSAWFPIVIFVILEIIAFIIGFSIKLNVLCDCGTPPCNCGPESSLELVMLAYGVIPSAIISLIAYFLIKRFVK